MVGGTNSHVLVRADAGAVGLLTSWTCDSVILLELLLQAWPFDFPS
jgi:hypothetical protein